MTTKPKPKKRLLNKTKPKPKVVKTKVEVKSIVEVLQSSAIDTPPNPYHDDLMDIYMGNVKVEPEPEPTYDATVAYLDTLSDDDREWIEVNLLVNERDKLLFEYILNDDTALIRRTNPIRVDTYIGILPVLAVVCALDAVKIWKILVRKIPGGLGVGLPIKHRRITYHIPTAYFLDFSGDLVAIYIRACRHIDSFKRTNWIDYVPPKYRDSVRLIQDKHFLTRNLEGHTPATHRAHPLRRVYYIFAMLKSRRML